MGVVSLSATARATAAPVIHLFQSQQQSPPPLLRDVLFPATRGSEGGEEGGGAFSISTRTQICFPQRLRRLLFARVKSVQSSSIVDGLQNFMGNFQNPPDEEHEDHRDSLNDVVENFPNPPEDSLDDLVENFLNSSSEEEQKRHISEASATRLPLDSKKLKAMAQMIEMGTDEQFHQTTLYLVDIGFDMNRIKRMVRKYPQIIYPGWGRKVRPLVEFLLDLGVPPSDIPYILYRAPNLCTISLSENIIPSMAYLETLGLDKSKWAKVIRRCPNLFTYSQQKVEATADYLNEMGLSRDRIGKVLTSCPNIVGFNVDGNLRLKAEYFQSMGVNLTSLLSLHPDIFRRSIECQLKPVTEFFLDKGYSIDEIGSMASWFATIYGLSLTKNLIPKWEFFLTMDYPRSVLVKHPHYFGYSLERRIKPRYAQMKGCGVKLSMARFLATSDSDFLVILNRMTAKKMLEAQQDSMAITSDEDHESIV